MWAVFFMRRPVQRNYAAKAAHGPRGEQGKEHPCSISDSQCAYFPIACPSTMKVSPSSTIQTMVLPVFSLISLPLSSKYLVAP